jgi:hypothetical protein
MAAIAFLRNRAISAGLLAFGAFLSKEEVLALPMIFTLWAIVNHTDVKRTVPAWIMLAVYFVLRNASGAVGISNAPPYYQFTFNPIHVATNVFEYADRSMTVAIGLIVASTIAFAAVPRPDRDDRRRMALGAIWLVLGFAVTIWLPIRSSLYAVFPSVGVAILTGAVLTAILRGASDQRAWRLTTVILVLPFALLPVYWSRNVRWTELRDLSKVTIRTIQADHLAPHTLVVLEDDLSTRANFRNVFGALVPEASALIFQNQLSLWIEPPPPELTGLSKPTHVAKTVSYKLVNGRLESRVVSVRSN